jgi:EAL domain-containing protein (putative c-di-GMP-specific phosphodiesterase class I)
MTLIHASAAARSGAGQQRSLCRRRTQGLDVPSMAVNVSGREFVRPGLLVRISETVEQARLPPAIFELELTEGVLMRDTEVARRSLLALKEFGFSLAMDDFGTGYCSAEYLKRFPIDTLKIDRSFVADIGTDSGDAAIVRAIIALGHDLNLKIVAEGVGTLEQLRFLRAEGCDTVQGFLVSQPRPSPRIRRPAAQYGCRIRSPAQVRRGESARAFVSVALTV